MDRSGPNVDCSASWGVPLAIFWIIALLAIFAAAACTGPGEPKKTVPPATAGKADGPDRSQLELPPRQFADLMPADPQPKDNSLRPGLSVVYFFSYFERHLDPLATIAATPGRGRAGKPIPYLDHSFGRQEVFDSGTNQGVAMLMKGLIRFPETGEYTFRAITNDGLRIYIGEVQIIDDPDNLPDRYTVQVIANIRQSGWYPLKVEYFQRKGTATIGLYWRTPRAERFVPVPAASFAHLP